MTSKAGFYAKSDTYHSLFKTFPVKNKEKNKSQFLMILVPFFIPILCPMILFLSNIFQCIPFKKSSRMDAILSYINHEY